MLSESLRHDARILLAETRGILFLGEGVKKAKGFTTLYFFLINAMLANQLLNQSYEFYPDKNPELTLSSLINFILSPQGTLFLTVWMLVVVGQYVLVPVIMKILAFIVRAIMVVSGNLIFFSIYLVLTKILRLKAEKKFKILEEWELLRYVLYLVGAFHYKNELVVRDRFFEFYKWYVEHVVYRRSRAASHVYVTASLFIATWIVLHQYKFYELAPVVYYIALAAAAWWTANAIIVSVVISRSGYFLYMTATSISYEDSLKLEQDSDE